MMLTDEENFLTPTALETRHRIFSFPRKAAVPTSKRSFAPWFLPALAHPAGDRTGANACCTETMLFIPKKQLACAWPPMPCQTRGGCIYLLVPLSPVRKKCRSLSVHVLGWFGVLQEDGECRPL